MRHFEGKSNLMTALSEGTDEKDLDFRRSIFRAEASLQIIIIVLLFFKEKKNIKKEERGIFPLKKKCAVKKKRNCIDPKLLSFSRIFEFYITSHNLKSSNKSL